MQIRELALRGWRNYDSAALTFDDSCNVIYGENAQGKTNLLEAIVYLSCGKSPRARSDRELMGFEGQEARVKGRILSRDREFVTEVQLYRGRRRRMTVNGVAAKNGAALSDVLHTVFFAPEDLFLIRAGAAERRRFMDTSLCQLRPRYGEALRQYERLYEHKTRILRDSEDKPELLDLLPEFNEGLCRSGAVLVGYRARFCAALAEYARQAHYECSGEREELTLTYRPSGPSPTRWAVRQISTRRWRRIWRAIRRRSVRRSCVSPAPTRTISRCWSTSAARGSSARRGRYGRRH